MQLSSFRENLTFSSWKSVPTNIAVSACSILDLLNDDFGEANFYDEAVRTVITRSKQFLTGKSLHIIAANWIIQTKLFKIETFLL
ncbi:hypothetical protein CHUAL_001749 [Chamberlinius hualienensis]